MLLGSIVNIILDPIFIFVFGWGVQGAALATVISQAISSTWVLRFLTSKKSTLTIKLKQILPKKSVMFVITSYSIHYTKLYEL